LLNIKPSCGIARFNCDSTAFLFVESTETSNWPRNSPDLNPADYSIRDVLWQLVYRQKFKEIDYLKQVLQERLLGHDQPRIINGAIDQGSKRLLLVVLSHGEYTQHRFR